MSQDISKNMQIAVCTAPDGNGFCIEHMPQFLLNDNFDDSAPHIHYFYEILWFQEGHGYHTVDFQDYEVTPNTLIFLSPGQIHHFDRNTNYYGISIKMNAEFMRSQEGTNLLFMKYNTFHTFDTTPCIHIDSDVAAGLLPLVNAMEEEQQRCDRFGNIDMLKALLRIFLIQIQRYGEHDEQSHLDLMKPSHQLFVRFRRIVEQEYRRKHIVREYAESLNVAVRTLNKCVNDCSHMSPLSFINERIVLEAKRMLRYTNLMLKEISYELGFEDPSYFVKFFKRHTGYLPSHFRELDM